MDRVCAGRLLLHEVQEDVFQEAASGEGGQAAGFVDGQEVGVVEEEFDVLKGVGFDPRRAVPDEGLAGDE